MNQNNISRNTLEEFLNNYLNIDNYKDYGPNGLQIQGTGTIKKVAFSVSATRESIIQAVKKKADALIVHHGLFWEFHGIRPIKGTFYHRVSPLIKNDINLLSYHLPLDGHQEVGNAYVLAKKIGLKNIMPFSPYGDGFLGSKGQFYEPILIDHFENILKKIMKRPILVSVPTKKKKIKNLGIITGGANSKWSHALKEGLDAYLTGEMSEHNWHEAKEAGITMFAAGHHATEQFGIQELMHLVQSKWNIKCFYIDLKNPA